MQRESCARRCVRVVLAISLVLACPALHAWGSLLLIEQPPDAATWALGPSLWTQPRYPGASTSRFRLLPGFDYYAPSGFFASTDTGVGWTLSRRSDLQAGVRLWPQLGRHGSDRPPGAAPIGDRLQAEAFLNVALTPALLLQSGLLAGSGRHRDGAQIEIGATSGLPVGQDLLGIGVAATFANPAYRQSYFGVSLPESTLGPQPAMLSNAPLAPLLPNGLIPAGWQDVSLTLSGEHRLGPHWRIDAQLVAARLLGAAARSPLVASRQQIGSTLTVWYEF